MDNDTSNMYNNSSMKLTDVAIRKLKSIGGTSESFNDVINRLIKEHEEIDKYIQSYVEKANGKCINEIILGRSVIANHCFDTQGKCNQCGIQGPVLIKQDDYITQISIEHK